MCTIAAMAGCRCCYMLSARRIPCNARGAQRSAVSRRPAFRRKNVAGQTWYRTKEECVSDYPSFHLLMHPCIIPSEPVCNLAFQLRLRWGRPIMCPGTAPCCSVHQFAAALLSNLLKCCNYCTFLLEFRRQRQVIHKQYSEPPFPADQFSGRRCELVRVLAGARNQMCYAAGKCLVVFAWHCVRQ